MFKCVRWGKFWNVLFAVLDFSLCLLWGSWVLDSGWVTWKKCAFVFWDLEVFVHECLTCISEVFCLPVVKGVCFECFAC